MISLKKYLDSVHTGSTLPSELNEGEIFSAVVAAYRSALQEMGNSSLDACPALGQGLKKGLGELCEGLSTDMSAGAVAEMESHVQEQLQHWGRGTASHYRQKTGEVRELLLVMARTAESVGERDQRCAGQLNEVTTRLKKIACLDDLTQIRASIEKSAAELKTSVARMTEEGKAAVEKLRSEVSAYQAKLEEAEEVASRDALTGLRSRLYAENQLERRIAAGTPLCAAIVDIDEFKKVNDEHGHLIGDELLKQFATELQSACRSTDMVGRWGGDEFIVLMDCGIREASAQIDRLKAWVCGDYKMQGNSSAKTLRVNASIGLAEHVPGETMKELLDRADAAMYQNKAGSRVARSGAKR